MKRLTSDKPVTEMGMLELAYNSCYAANGEARYRDYDLDIDARSLTRKLLKDHADGDDAFTCDEDLDEWMVDYLQDGMDSIEGLIALFYRNLWAMADLRERLKYYEDLEGHGTLLKLPCAVGDTVWYWDKEYDPIEEAPFEGYVSGYEIVSAKTVYIIIVPKTKTPSWIPHDVKLEIDDFGKSVFLVREEAEAALKEMSEGQGKDRGMEELKKCPFCNGEADFESKENYSAHTFWRVVCNECGCGTWCDEDGFGYEDNPGKQKAIDEWNDRV